MKAPTTYLTGNAEWYTPPDIIAAVHAVLGHIDLDAASCEVANRIVLADNFFSIDDDGLDCNWFGRVYLNPPYSRGLIKKFVNKFIAEYKAGHVDGAIILVNVQTDSKWFKTLAELCTAAIFTQGRIRFVQPDGIPSKHTPTCGQCFFYFGNDVEKFFFVFELFGYPVKFLTRQKN